jgi:hypothetical protein
MGALSRGVSTRYEEIKQLCFVEAGLVEKHEHPAEKWIPYRDFGTIGKIIVSNFARETVLGAVGC